MLNAGRLDRRIELQARVTSVGELGEELTNWLTFATVWAGRLTQSASSRVLGPELVSDQSVVWSLRYRDDVTSKCRLLHGTKVYRIDGVYEGREREAEMFLVTTREEPERGAEC